MLTILGSGGWFPAFGRHTACALLRNRDRALMIDAGTGVGRLMERRELLDGVQTLDIVLSHFHLDHVAGLAYLPALGFRGQTTLWGPGQLLYGTATRQILGEVSREPFHPIPLERQDISVRDLPAGELELTGVRVATRRQDRHSAPSLAFRFEDTLTWITDTAFDSDSARFAAGSAVVAHEAWYTAAEPLNETIHSSALQAAQVALDAGARQLLLMHLPPFTSGLEPILEEAHTVFAQAELASEGAAVAAVA